jgi:hypothetical protein
MTNDDAGDVITGTEAYHELREDEDPTEQVTGQKRCSHLGL